MPRVLFFLITLALAPADAAIIDRIAVTLDSQVITESEIMLEIRLTALLNGEPVDATPQARKKAANRLIEQKLIRREVELGRYVQPSPGEEEPMLKQIHAQRFHGPDDYQKALEKYGVDEAQLRAHLLWQLTLLRFIEVRFPPSVEVTDEDMHQYFVQHLPELEKRAGKPVNIESVRNEIRDALTEQLVDKQLNDWLAEARGRTHIAFHPEAFQ
ncbi:MAG TPA: hypothetical protein VFO27_05830 [Bryobacteraceae bacterium]|nr:hypothetical protein [Bryobacteraceae bacterium]